MLLHGPGVHGLCRLFLCALLLHLGLRLHLRLYVLVELTLLLRRRRVLRQGLVVVAVVHFALFARCKRVNISYYIDASHTMDGAQLMLSVRCTGEREGGKPEM